MNFWESGIHPFRVRVGWGAALFSLATAAWSQTDILPIDEANLFADTTTVFEMPNSDAKDSGKTQQDGFSDKKSVSLTGSILILGNANVTRDYFKDFDEVESDLTSQAITDAHIDARLLRGFKAYTTLEWKFSPTASQGQPTVNPSQPGAATTANPEESWRIPEMFLDANFAHQVYFRAGKQILQWGRCQFFTPTDLVNVEAPTFLQRIGSREGAYGLKTHIPFGTKANIYGFLDVGHAGRPDSLAGAVKIETLFGGTEIAASFWDGGHRDPVYGADFSSRLLGWDVFGEGALHTVWTRRTVRATDSPIPLLVYAEDQWIPKAALGISKGFDINGIPDRMLFEGEYYFNAAGTSQSSIPLPSESVTLPGLSPQSIMATAIATGFYTPNDYSRHYAAAFLSFSRFIRTDLTLSFNALTNLDQLCTQWSGGIGYQDLNDFSLTLNLIGFAGPKNSEYTLYGSALQAQLMARVVF